MMGEADFLRTHFSFRASSSATQWFRFFLCASAPLRELFQIFSTLRVKG